MDCDLWYTLLYIHYITFHVVYSVVYTLYHNSTCCKVSIYNKWIVICGILCCIYIISQFTCCKVSIYNKWIVICGILCCIYIISQFTCCKVSIYNKWIVICGIYLLYIQYITIHLLYGVYIQPVDCDLLSLWSIKKDTWIEMKSQ